MNRINRIEDLLSSDDSDDDNYNYLTVLDNLNWNLKPKDRLDRQDSGHTHQLKKSDNWPTDETNDHKKRVDKKDKRNDSKSVAKEVSKPAVAVKSRSNRNDCLLKDMIASEKDKYKEITKSDTNCVTAKRDLEEDIDEDMDEQLNDILVLKENKSHTIEAKNELKTNYSNNSTTYAKNKRQKSSKIDESEYSVTEVLNQKKANHQKCVHNNNNTKNEALDRLNSDRLFGKAFSPTVYSPEVPVMRPVPQTSGQSHQKSMPLMTDESSLSDSKYNPKAILTVILDWNTKWLNECTPTEVPPPLSPFGEGIGVKTCYESLDEYQSAYIPLILFETWAQIYDDFHKTKRSDGSNSFRAVVAPDYSSDEHFITIAMQTVVHRNRTKAPNLATEGSLVLLELCIDCGASNEKKKVVFFGYVTDLNSETIAANTSLLPGLVVAPTTHNSNQVLLRYTVLMSKRPIRVNSRELINVRVVHYLKPTMRQIELIAGLNTCPLFKDILRPRSFTCQVVVPTNVCLSTANFNESQSRAILGSSEALCRPYAVPKLLFIQGPPGTGKTHTLIGIIKHLYMKWDTPERLPRILICAPSNGAVDEIARRLYRERRFLQKHKCERALRCVRIGQGSQIHPEVRKISLEALVAENADNDEKKLSAQKQKQTQELEAKVSRLDQEMANYRASNRKNDLLKSQTEMQNLMHELLKLSSAPKPTETNKNRLKLDLMVKADVVLSTLNSSRQSSIDNLFRNYGPKTFDCVIVDEASQCSEPELLMPLAYKMTKMILIGDPMQLPATVISKKASSLQLGRSLFERFFHYFRECEHKDPNQKSPILMLTEQYRMHPQICQFPSNHFYDGRLTSSEKVVQNRDFKLKPYIVFDVTDTQENRSDPTNKYNEFEANFVVRLISIIDQMIGSADSNHKHSIGVITPYNGQKNCVNRKIEDKNFKVSVEVNTVDGFQGQERDVIILSCVRAFDSNHSNSIGFLNSIQRMNVALTRAKYSMIVCVSGRSLESDPNWKALIDNAMKRTNTRFKVPSTLAADKLKRMLERIEVISCE